MISTWPRAIMLAALVTLPQSCVLAQQSSPCDVKSSSLQSNDPAYTDAMELAEMLREHGFEIKCMFPSIQNSLFMVLEGDNLVKTIEGEVAFITNRGSFSAFFVPNPQTFADFHVSRKPSDQGYAYIFSGTPKSGTTQYGTAHRTYFLKRDNFLIISGEETRKALEQTLGVKADSP